MPNIEYPLPDLIIINPIAVGDTRIVLNNNGTLDNQIVVSNNAKLLGQVLGTQIPEDVKYTSLSTARDFLYLRALGINPDTHPVTKSYPQKIRTEGFLSAGSLASLLPTEQNFLNPLFPSNPTFRTFTLTLFQSALTAALIPPGTTTRDKVLFNKLFANNLYLNANPAITNLTNKTTVVESLINNYIFDSSSKLVPYSAVSATNVPPDYFFQLPYKQHFVPVQGVPVGTEPGEFATVFDYPVNGPNNYIFTNNAYIAYLSAVSANINTLYVSSLSTDVISSTKAYFDNLYANTSYLTSVSATQLSGLSAFINNLSTTNISALYIEAAKISATELTALSSFSQYLSSVSGIVDALSSYNLSATQLTALSGYIPELTSINLTSTNISALYIEAAKISATELTALSSFSQYLSSVSGIVDALSSYNLSATRLTALSAYIPNLSSINIVTDHLTAKNTISAKDIYADTVSAKNLHADNLAEKLDDLSDVIITDASPNHILVYDGSNWINFPMIGSNGGNLDDLKDVVITSPLSAGQVLVFDGAKWINNTVGGGNSGASVLNDLLDVIISNPPSKGEFLRYNGTKWVNTTVNKEIYDSLSATNLSGENLTLYNTNTSIPALRVTQEGEQHVAVFYDRRGRPELNIDNIVVGGILNPGSNEVFVFATNKVKSVSGWGSNPSGQLLDTNTIGYPLPISRDINVNQIATFGMHVIALSADNTIAAWGSNIDGQLGDNTLINKTIPVNIGGNYRYVAAGSGHSAAINSSSSLYTWGRNLFGELGIGLSGPSNSFRSTPQLVGAGYTHVALGGNHSIALKQDNSLWCWGSNEYYQLGFTTFAPHIQTTPTQVTSLQYKQISCGMHHSAAIDVDDNLWMWGSNGEGQIGSGTSDVYAMIPFKIPNLKFKKVSCGYFHTLAITTDNQLYAWGKNSDGQLGRGDLSNLNTNIPTLVDEGRKFEHCAAGPNCSFAITPTGDVFAWGNNQLNQLGSGFVDANILSPFNTIIGDPAPVEVALVITGSEQAPGFVGIKTDSPNCELTVNGDISASGTIYGNISSAVITTDTLTSNNLITLDLSCTKLNADTLTSLSANISSINNVSINSVSAVVGSLSTTNITSTSLSTINLTGSNAVFANLTSVNLSATNGNFDKLTSVWLTGVSAFFDNLSSQTIYTDAITAKSAKIDGDLEITGKIKGNITGNTTSDTLCSTNITGVNIFALSSLAVGTTNLNLIRDLNTSFYVDGNAIITGNLSALGDVTYLDTNVIATTAFEISNPGTRTSLVVNQSGGLDVARFYYNHQGWGSGPALIIKGHANAGGPLYGPGYVGIRTETPNEALTVQGSISASENIYTDSGVIRGKTISATNITAINAHFENATLKTDGLTTKNIAVTSLSAQNITGLDLYSNSITSLSSYSDVLTAAVGIFSNLTATKGNFSTLTAASANILELASDKINTNYLSAINLEVSNITSYGVPDFQSDITVRGNANVIGNLSADRIYGTLYTTTVVNVGDAIDIIEVKAQRGRFTTDLSARATITPYLTANYADIGFIKQINTTAGYITSISARDIITSNLTTVNLTGSYAEIDFIKEINTPIGYITSLSVNSLTGTYAEIDFIKEINTPTGYITSLSVQTITADSSTINNLQILNISAKSLILEDDAVRCLHIKQAGGAEAFRIDYKNSADIINPAFVVRTSDTPSNPIYGPGYVGIRTENPTEALTVNGNILTNTGNITANGNVVGNNVSARVSLSAGTVIRGATINVEDAIIADNLDVGGNATVTNLTAYNTMYVGGRTDIDNDLHVSGRIFGEVIGTITNNGTVKLNDISAVSITTDFLTAKNSIISPSISSRYILTETGNSDMWTSAYHIPVTINLIINGGGVQITPSTKGYIELPYDIKLVSWSMFADDISVFPTAMYILSSDYESFPDTVPIFTEAPTILPGDIKNKSTSLQGWATDLPSGTVLHFGVSAVPIPGGIADINATLLTLSLKGYRN